MTFTSRHLWRCPNFMALPGASKAAFVRLLTSCDDGEFGDDPDSVSQIWGPLQLSTTADDLIDSFRSHSLVHRVPGRHGRWRITDYPRLVRRASQPRSS